MAEFLSKFKVWIFSGIGLLLYLCGRRDGKEKQVEINRKGQLNVIQKVKVAQFSKYESDRIKRLHDKYRRR